MSIKEMEAALEATRQKIADQGRIVDARLLEKERLLEQAVIDTHLDAENDTQKHTYARPNRRYMTAGMYLPSATSPELAIALNHITNVTLQDLLAEYND